MKITPVDDKNTLFLIEDILSEETLNKIDEMDLLDIPWIRQNWQEDWERRLLEPDESSHLNNVANEIEAHKKEIGDAVGMSFIEINSRFWIDTEGFTVDPHIDNPGVRIALQIYLKGCENVGTTFYSLKEEDVIEKEDAQRYHFPWWEGLPPVRYTFEGKRNTGYIMLNDKTQLHGVPITLGKDTLRLSAYCNCKE